MSKNINKRATPRKKALDILIRLDKGDGYLDVLAGALLGDLAGLDRAFAMELAYGVTRWLIKLDWIINFFSTVKVGRMERLVLNVLRLGVYQLLFLNKVPPHAAVDESVKLIKGVKNRRKRDFVNAVLHKVDRERMRIIFPNIRTEPVRYLSVVHSHPEWLVKRWLGRYGTGEVIKLCQANNRLPPTVVRCNTVVTTRKQLVEKLNNEGLDVRNTPFSPFGVEIIDRPPSYSLLDSANFYIQDEASQLIPFLVAPAAGETILDACSAPGGKATELAQMMSNDGKIYAMDISPARLKLIQDLSKRLGADIVSVVEGNALREITFASPGGFDVILMDGPCSGLGTIRRNPDIKYRKNEDDIGKLSGLQRALIENLSRYLKEGGRFVYATCTTEPEENECVIESFLRDHREFEVEDSRNFLPEVCSGLVDCKGYLRTLPHRDNMDGFFGVRLRKLSQ